ncbi:ribonuclease P protein component [Microbulbifer aggregans]|uniref:ribonuclease P protein component n=1 Tax=Microbulbifer aggregans TaxID=1769779 RepID=UPI00299DC382|nr:ribonuclease P protein component [Microbulbifer aggregans]
MQHSRSDFAFGKPLRLLTASHYRVVFDDAPVRAAHPQFLILARPNGLDHPRMGLVIAKKHVRHACNRNRIKRIARETFRLQQQQLFPLDAVVLARPGAGELDKAELAKVLQKLWRKLDQRARNPQPQNKRAGPRKGSDKRNKPGSKRKHTSDSAPEAKSSPGHGDPQ